ncbi:MAG: cbb3-type cytochrome c oxidase subunit 3 [Burkholderiales bacterium]|nr:cbb3-type cytochrome c oxidase subunit 3 [Burkholderiales bacterium]
MDINILRIMVTALSFAVFLGIVAWAVWPANRQRFEADAMIPFDDDVKGT